MSSGRGDGKRQGTNSSLFPLAHRRCGGDGFPGCGAALDALGDRAAACSRSGLLARRAGLGAGRARLGLEGRGVPQQWVANTSRGALVAPAAAQRSPPSTHCVPAARPRLCADRLLRAGVGAGGRCSALRFSALLVSPCLVVGGSARRGQLLRASPTWPTSSPWPALPGLAFSLFVAERRSAPWHVAASGPRRLRAFHPRPAALQKTTTYPCIFVHNFQRKTVPEK